ISISSCVVEGRLDNLDLFQSVSYLNLDQCAFLAYFLFDITHSDTSVEERGQCAACNGAHRLALTYYRETMPWNDTAFGHHTHTGPRRPYLFQCLQFLFPDEFLVQFDYEP